MPQFQKRSSQPLSPESYRAAARRLRDLAALVDRYSDARDTRQHQQLTRAIHGLSAASQALSRRHRKQSLADNEQHQADDYDAAVEVRREDYEG